MFQNAPYLFTKKTSALENDRSGIGMARIGVKSLEFCEKHSLEIRGMYSGNWRIRMLKTKKLILVRNLDIFVSSTSWFLPLYGIGKTYLLGYHNF